MTHADLMAKHPYLALIAKADEHIIPEPNTGCWIWSAYLDRDGYGRYLFRAAYRITYENEIGSIPNKNQIDHLCRNRWCVNPIHLEIVTAQENVRRRRARQMQHCKRGHDYSGRNIGKNGRTNTCAQCKRERENKYYWRDN